MRGGYADGCAKRADLDPAPTVTDNEILGFNGLFHRGGN